MCSNLSTAKIPAGSRPTALAHHNPIFPFILLIADSFNFPPLLCRKTGHQVHIATKSTNGIPFHSLTQRSPPVAPADHQDTKPNTRRAITHGSLPVRDAIHLSVALRGDFARYGSPIRCHQSAGKVDETATV